MKKLLFVIDSLSLGGAEKSLTTLLNLIDLSSYEVDLQLFSYGGEFEALLPDQVNLLPPIPFFCFCSNPLMESIKLINNKASLIYLLSRIRYSLRLRKKKFNHIEKSVIMWRSVNKCFTKAKKEYDIAIAYAQGVPTFYVADCVNAREKYAWINATYIPKDFYRSYITNYYYKFDKVVCVSDTTHQEFQNTFPEVRNKSLIIYDINDFDFISKMSLVPSKVEEEFDNDANVKLLTIGRFCESKGYDIAIDAARILKNRGFSFCWYVLGRGELEKEIRERIAEFNLEDKFILLGIRSNPYPYIRQCDVYVQTSRLEGFGLAIAEARMLNKPVVVTEFNSVYAQMIQGKNGLVVSLNPESVANGIQRMIEDDRLRNSIISYLKKEKKGNTEEMEKVNSLLSI